MKKVIYFIACSLVLGLLPVNASAAAALTTFDLKFPGGGPTDLVNAIEAASGKPLNVIISKQDEDTEIPPLKMTGVNVAQLFEALEPMSVKTVAVITGTYNYGPGQPSSQYTTTTTSYGFKTTGDPTENSIWYFHVQRPSYPPLVSSGKVCRFYSLAPYLERGFTVDDITTAIQTGWKMAKDSSPPELHYHQETKLLIAFGDPDELKTIDDVLKTLPESNATRTELDSIRKEIKDLTAKVYEGVYNTTRAEMDSMGQEIKELQAKVNKLSPPAH
ncbi:MAG TPA: hypothetical protein VMR33_00975 [Candidatus Baltobacteraceae bacterium]|jgi:hypothetical protein|nr:hypothetical protein [Candidatus Baltobacteraceae bacterium]